MENDGKLKLIKSPEPLKKANTFWRACPRLLKYLPESHCDKGKPITTGKSKRVQDDPECPWWINSSDHNYCFWKFVHDKSSKDGVMNELVQSELANLFGWSNTKTHFILKEAIEELTEALHVHGAIALLSEMDDVEVEEFLSVTSDSYVDDSDGSYE